MICAWCTVVLFSTFCGSYCIDLTRVREIYRRSLTSIYWCRRWCFRRTRGPARRRTGKWTPPRDLPSTKGYRAAGVPYETNEPYAFYRRPGRPMSPPGPFRCYYFPSSFLSTPFEKRTFLISLFNTMEKFHSRWIIAVKWRDVCTGCFRNSMRIFSDISCRITLAIQLLFFLISTLRLFKISLKMVLSDINRNKFLLESIISSRFDLPLYI